MPLTLITIFQIIIGASVANGAPDTQDWGAQFDQTPFVAAGSSAPFEKVDLAVIREHLSHGEPYRALRAANALLEQRPRRETRHVTHMVQGMIYRQLGHHNLASESFTRVRVSELPLAHWGAYFEAEQDLRRGKPRVAAKECVTLRQKFPNSRFDEPCRRIIALGYAGSGKIADAQGEASEYEADEPLSFLQDGVALFSAMWMRKHNPKRAAEMARKLSISHRHPMMGKAADNLIQQLVDDHGVTLPPLTLSQQRRRAISLRKSGRKDEAWSAFGAISRAATEGSHEENWVALQGPEFAWRSRKYKYLVTKYSKRHLKEPSPEIAWKAMSAAWRAGAWDDVHHWLKLGDEAYKDAYKWRRSHEDIGRIWMLAGQYTEATVRFQRLAERRGSTGRAGKFLEGFAAYMGGKDDHALRALNTLIDGRRGDLDQYRYWRAKVLIRSGNGEAAKTDQDWILKERPNSWYAFLVHHAQRQDNTEKIPHTGQWQGLPLDAFETAPSELAHGSSVPVASFTPRLSPPQELSPLSQLRWPLKSVSNPPPPPAPVAEYESIFLGPNAPPQTYGDTLWFNASATATKFSAVQAKVGQAWPQFSEARLLASGGLYDWSGPTFARFFQSYKKAISNSSHPQHLSARAFSLGAAEWKPYFYYTRDHYDTMRHNYGTWKAIPDLKNRRDVERLHWPIAYGATVWRHSRAYNVDPFFVLAIMRAESRYDATAISHAGAMGPMQIMPRTGRLLSLGRGDIHFDVESLYHPTVAIDYGVQFLGLLLERFGGAFHLAAASYNGGPFAVSSWLKGTGHDMPIDEWVEHILYAETRRYVKRVSMYYQDYLRLYDVSNAQVHYPDGPYRDDPTIVDF